MTAAKKLFFSGVLQKDRSSHTLIRPIATQIEAFCTTRVKNDFINHRYASQQFQRRRRQRSLRFRLRLAPGSSAPEKGNRA
jgi:hypothetical protein